MAPYVKSTKILIDPMDPWQDEDARIKDQMAVMGGANTPEARAYALAVRSNIGYNYAFLQPLAPDPRRVRRLGGDHGERRGPNRRRPSCGGTSIWDRDPGGGTQGRRQTG